MFTDDTDLELSFRGCHYGLKKSKNDYRVSSGYNSIDFASVDYTEKSSRTFDGSIEDHSAEFRIPASNSMNSPPLSPHPTRQLPRTSSETSFPSPQLQPLSHNEMRKYDRSHALEAGGARAQAARFIKSGTKKVGGAERVGAPRKAIAAANFARSVLWLHSPGG